MDEAKILEILRTRLSIEVRERSASLGGSADYIEIKLCLDGESISEAYFDLPRKD